MSDLIEREDAIKAIDKRICELQRHPTFKRKNADIDLYGVKELIINLPSARPQGEWKAKSFHEVYCDNCGFSFDIMKCDFLENMKHCPNCGARMRGAENGSDKDKSNQ